MDPENGGSWLARNDNDEYDDEDEKLRPREDRESFTRFQKDLLVDTMSRFGWSRTKVEEKLSQRAEREPPTPEVKVRIVAIDETEEGIRAVQAWATNSASLQYPTQVRLRASELSYYETYRTAETYQTAYTYQTGIEVDSKERLTRLAEEQGMVLVSKADAALLVMRLEADALRQQREDTTKPVVIHIKNKREFQ